MERYRVRRDREVRFIVDAIERSGGQLINDPDPRVAPFELRVLSPAKERLDLICYAFSANKYRQQNRPADEHRFQIKYGSDFRRYHEIFIDPDRSQLTLMFGSHLEEDVLVAVDPAMHNPTWFSKSVEFKDSHVAEIHRIGWYGWERERSLGRRKVAAPLLNCQTEVLVGFVPEHFFRLAELERIATGLAPGERLLLADRLAARSELLAAGSHPLEHELALPAWKILDLIDGAFRLKVAVRGSAAEEHLRRHLEKIPGIDGMEHLDLDGRPDFKLTYRGGKPIFLECKNVLRKKVKDRVKVDFQKTRASASDPCTRYYRPGDFSVLAACLHPITEAWDFRFCRTASLEPHHKCPGKLSNHVYVDGPSWTESLGKLLDQL